MVSSPNHTFFWASLNQQLTSTSCTYLSLLLTTTLLEWFSKREENDRRNYFMINLQESMGWGWDQTRHPWICSQTRIYCQTVTNCAMWPGLIEKCRAKGLSWHERPTKTQCMGVLLHSLIRVTKRHSMSSQGSNIFSSGKLRLWLDCADAQTIWIFAVVPYVAYQPNYAKSAFKHEIMAQHKVNLQEMMAWH